MTMLDDSERTEALRKRYLANQVQTASPAQRLLLLQAQLLADLEAAGAAFEADAIEPIHRKLVHAQEILLALHDSLEGSDWSGAQPLRAVYAFVHQRLVACNMEKDRSLLPECFRLMQQIHDANVHAAAALAQPAPGTTAEAVPLR